MRSSILVVNPGSTSTKLAVWRDGDIRERETIRHAPEDLAAFSDVWAQRRHRLDECRKWLKPRLSACAAVSTLGGLFRPVGGGVYRVTHRMLEDARAAARGEHASNIGCAMADDLAREFGCEAFVVDPVSVDEFEPLARYSGHPLIERRSLSHAVSLHGAARWAARELNLRGDASSCIVAHLGGGISIAPVRCGLIVDVNDASSDGPFSPERTGGLPLQPFITLALERGCDERQLRTLVMGQGGLFAYLGTTSAEEVEQRIGEGDKEARGVYEAMAYQIAKEIGSMATVLSGSVDAIVLTGGLAHSRMLTTWIEERVRFIAPVLVRPGELEMELIAQYTQDVLTGELQAQEY